MIRDPDMRLSDAFGTVLKRRRRERNWSIDELATAAGLSVQAARDIEAGVSSPSLTDFSYIAVALGESPIILLVDVVTALRAEPDEYGSYPSRASDFVRLYRLGYLHGPGDFREQNRPYGTVDEATGGATSLNLARRTKGVAPLDTVLIYVRLGYVQVDVRPEAGGQRE